MSNPHSAEVKEDKREWLVIEHNGEMKILTSDSELATKNLMRMYPNCVSRIVPASEKQRLQTLLEEATKVIEFYSVRKHICSHDDSSWCNEFCYDSGDMAREFLGRVKK